MNRCKTPYLFCINMNSSFSFASSYIKLDSHKIDTINIIFLKTESKEGILLITRSRFDAEACDITDLVFSPVFD